MKKLHILYAFAAAAFLLTACDTDVEHDIAQVDAPVFVSATPETGSTVKTGNVTVTLQYDKNIYFASEDASQISISWQTAPTVELLTRLPFLPDW